MQGRVGPAQGRATLTVLWAGAAGGVAGRRGRQRGALLCELDSVSVLLAAVHPGAGGEQSAAEPRQRAKARPWSELWPWPCGVYAAGRRRQARRAKLARPAGRGGAECCAPGAGALSLKPEGGQGSGGRALSPGRRSERGGSEAARGLSRSGRPTGRVPTGVGHHVATRRSRGHEHEGKAGQPEPHKRGSRSREHGEQRNDEARHGTAGAAQSHCRRQPPVPVSRAGRAPRRRSRRRQR